MNHCIVVEPESMDVFLNSNIRQLIVPQDDVVDRPESLSVTDGARKIRCEPIEIIDCYFEEKKVTIKEGSEYIPYLWSDREVVNIAVMQGYTNGDTLREMIEQYGKYLVIRW